MSKLILIKDDAAKESLDSRKFSKRVVPAPKRLISDKGASWQQTVKEHKGILIGDNPEISPTQSDFYEKQ